MLALGGRAGRRAPTENIKSFNLSELFDEEGNAIEEKFKELGEWFKANSDAMSGKDRETVESILADWDRYTEQMTAITSYVESLFGDMSSNVADSMIDSWIETGDAIADATDLVDDYAKAMAKAAVQKLLLESVFTPEAQEKLIELMKGGNVEDALALISGLIEEANALGPAINEIFEGIDDVTGGAMSDTSSDREPYKKGIATASQDAQMISRLTAIERNTAYLSTISTNISAISSDIESIKNKGVPMQ